MVVNFNFEIFRHVHIEMINVLIKATNHYIHSQIVTFQCYGEWVPNDHRMGKS